MLDEKKEYTEEELLDLAKNGESDAYVLLGMRLYGDGARADKKAMEYYKKAADMGNVEAMSRIVNHLKDSHDVKEIDICNKYAKMGYDRGNNQCAVVYLSNMARGNGMPADLKGAKKEFKQLAKSGDPKILTGLGELYIDEKLDKVNVKKAIKFLTAAAEQNYDFAEFDLAHLYYNGRLMKPDLEKAEEYFIRAKKHGFGSLVDEYIADIYKQNGNIDGQISSLESGMNEGNEDACLQLIDMYKKGLSVKKDKKKAFEIALKGAKMGYPYAMCIVGDMYEDKGTDEDIMEAVKWYRKAAKLDMEEAAEEIVRLHSNCGDKFGITEDEVKKMKAMISE